MGTSESKGGRPARNGDKPFTEIFRQLIQGETQQVAADKIGVSRQNIGKWLSGSTTPDIETLCRIADAYNVPTDYLLGRTPNKTTDTELKAVCDYTGLTENAIENIKRIGVKGNIDVFNALCETGDLIELTEILTVYALNQCAALIGAKLYRKKKQKGEGTEDVEKIIKQRLQRAEYQKVSVSLQADRILAISARSLTKKILNLSENEYHELLNFTNSSFSKDDGLNSGLDELEELMNSIDEHKGADGNG